MAKKTHILVILVCFFTLIGSVLILFITRQGIGITPDSVIYITSAHNLFTDKGLCTISPEGHLVAMTHYPPLYPILITFGQLLSFKVLSFCKILNIIIFCLNIILFGLIIYKSTEGNIWASLFGSLFMITSYDVVRIHLCVSTDPIFIFFMLIGLFVLNIYLENNSFIYLIVSALLISCAFLTRYVGLSLIFATLMGIAFLSNRGSKRIYACLVFLIISITPTLLWMVRNIYHTGNPFNRTFGYRQIAQSNFPEKLKHILEIIGSLSLSIHLILLFTLIIMILFIYLIIKTSHKYARKTGYKFERVPILMILFTLNYLAFVILSLLFFDSAIYLGYRIILPLTVSITFLIIYYLSKLLNRNKFIILCTILLVLQLFRFDLKKVNENELVYSGSKWTSSQIINKVKAIPEHILIYSNGFDAIYFLTGKTAFSIPEDIICDKNEINIKLDSQLESIANQFNSKCAILVWCDNISWRNYLVSKEKLINKLNLVKIYQAEDGSIYTTENNLNEFNDKSQQLMRVITHK